MADAGSPWSVWGGLVEAASIAVSALVGGVAAIVGIVWRGGHASAAKAAREQHHADELAGLSTNIARIDALALRVSAIESQQTMIASSVGAMSIALRDMRTEMAVGFDSLRSRQDRMIEISGRNLGG